MTAGAAGAVDVVSAGTSWDTARHSTTPPATTPLYYLRPESLLAYFPMDGGAFVDAAPVLAAAQAQANGTVPATAPAPSSVVVTGPNRGSVLTAGVGVAGGALYFTGQTFADTGVAANPSGLSRVTVGGWVRLTTLVTPTADPTSPDRLRCVVTHGVGVGARGLCLLADAAATGVAWVALAAVCPDGATSGDQCALGHVAAPAAAIPQTNEWTFVAISYDVVAGACAVCVCGCCKSRSGL